MIFTSPSPILLEANAGPGTGLTERERGDQQVDGFGERGGREPAAELNFLS